MANLSIDVEQIIGKSKLGGEAQIRLKEVPADDIGELCAILGKVVNVYFLYRKINGYLSLTSIRGYVGKEEKSEKQRTIWEWRFAVPLPVSKFPWQRFSVNYGENFAVVVNGVKYLFRKADGSYLGKVFSESTAQSL